MINAENVIILRNAGVNNSEVAIHVTHFIGHNT